MKYHLPWLAIALVLLVDAGRASNSPAALPDLPGETPACDESARRYFDFALTAASRIQDDRFRADGLRAEVARGALQSERLPVAAKALSGMSPNDYRFPLLCAEWLLRGGKRAPSDAAHLTLDHSWNLAVTLAPRRRAETLAALKAGFPELAERQIPVAEPPVSGAIAAEVAGFRFSCLRILKEGKFPGAAEWDLAVAMAKGERFAMDPEGLLLTDCLIEMGFEILRRDAGADLGKLKEAIEATLVGSKVPSVPQGLGFARLLLASGEKEKAGRLLEGVSGAVGRISPRNPLRTDFESRLVELELLGGMPEKAATRASGLPVHLAMQMDYEQFLHAGEVLAALLSTGQAGEAMSRLQRLVELAGKNDNPNNLRFLQGSVALAIAQSGIVTKVSQSIPREFDTLLGRP
jgi:hypothetical protein